MYILRKLLCIEDIPKLDVVVTNTYDIQDTNALMTSSLTQ